MLQGMGPREVNAEAGRGAERRLSKAEIAELAQPIRAASGLVLIDKPLGWTSMDVVRRLRRALREAMDEPARSKLPLHRIKAGHAGTLDPLATGLVICCVGRATRLVESLMGLAKVYEAEVDLSAFTTTDDLEGEREPVAVSHPPSAEAVHAAIGRFIGRIEQTPPAYSAVHVGGKRAYQLARSGKPVQLTPKVVRIDAIEVTSYAWPRLSLRVTCGRGTYIRSLARDLGRAMEVGGHLSALRRTAVGPYHVDAAWTGDRLDQPVGLTELLPSPEPGAADSQK